MEMESSSSSSSDKEKQPQIALMSRDVSRRISTAQVIISLPSAVRQLIDNSLDANATSIEVRTNNYGAGSLEVVDDGTGIIEESFSSLCQPHSTSKMSQYDDLLSLNTLGFRGEALNALCVLGRVTITTRSDETATAFRLKFDNRGNITQKDVVPRQRGTTVLVESLFHEIPVRRRELERTAKRDFTRLLAVVQEFALSRPEIRFNVYSMLNGKRHHALCSPGGVISLKDTITSLFGGRSEKSEVIEIVKGPVDEESRAFYSISEEDSDLDKIGISGFVSSCDTGQGRGTGDRQFIYINQRPVDYPKVCRIANELYQQYNRYQYPTLVLQINIPPEWVDVNVTPDKRVVFCRREKHVLCWVRAALTATFLPFRGKMTSVEGLEGPSTPTPSSSSRSLSASLHRPSSARSDSSSLNNSFTGSTPRRVQTDVPAGFTSNKICQPKAKKARIGDVGMQTLQNFAFKIIPHTAKSENSNDGGIRDDEPVRDPSEGQARDLHHEEVPSNSTLPPVSSILSQIPPPLERSLLERMSRGFEEQNELEEFAHNVTKETSFSTSFADTTMEEEPVDRDEVDRITHEDDTLHGGDIFGDETADEQVRTESIPEGRTERCALKELNVEPKQEILSQILASQRRYTGENEEVEGVKNEQMSQTPSQTLSNTGLASVEEYAEDNDMVGGNKNPAIKKGRKPRKSSMRRLIDVDDGFGFGSEEDEAETNLHEKRLSRKRNSAYDNTEKPAKRNTRGEYRTRAENALVLNLALTEKYRQYLIGKNENNAIPSFSARALEARQEFCAELLMDYGLKIRPDAVHRAIRYKMEIVRRAHAEDPRVVRETGDVPITPPPSLAEHLHPLYDALYHSFRNTKSGYMSNIVVNDESIIAEEKCHRFYQDSESYSQEQMEENDSAEVEERRNLKTLQYFPHEEVICEGTVESEAPPHKNRKTSVSSQNEEVVGLLSEFMDNQMEEMLTAARGTERVEQVVEITMESLRAARKKANDKETESERVTETSFSAGMVPEENELAERELSKALKKSDFSRMTILGQFNDGFIITRLGDHLFIVDQHASDEKYNFERFQKKAKVTTQTLINPMKLNMGAVQEAVIKENVEIFRVSGFDFDFSNPDGAFLVKAPTLHNWNFDLSDLDEMVSALSAHPHQMYRPSRLRAIFASRACRTSVMIGTRLQQSKMEEIVRHLGALDQPWNCPHGRPTLRHLADLSHI